MQITVTTDYAIRALLCIAINDKLLTKDEIATQMGIPSKYAPKILTKLRRLGFIHIARGSTGGCYMVKKPCQITLLDMIVGMEGKLAINRCLEEDSYCSRFATETCPVRNVYGALQSSVEKYCESITFQDLMNEM